MTSLDSEDRTLSEMLEAAPAIPDLKPADDPTSSVYPGLQAAWRHFNTRLFQDRLPPVLFTLTRAHTGPGWFTPNRFVNDAGIQVSELALNPAWFTVRSLTTNLAELVHQMLHHLQHLSGKPGREGYHNRQYASLANQIGLITTDNGAPTGHAVGQVVSFIIVEDEAFDRAARELLTEEFRMAWYDRFPAIDEAQAEAPRITRAALLAARQAGKRPASAADAAGDRDEAPSAPVAGTGAPHPEPSSKVDPLWGDADTPEHPASAVDTGTDLPSAQPSKKPLERALPDLSPAARSVIQFDREPTRSRSGTRARFVCSKGCGQMFYGKSSLQVACKQDGGDFVVSPADEEGPGRRRRRRLPSGHLPPPSSAPAADPGSARPDDLDDF